MYITYDYYRIFYYVAKYGSFTQAAKALFSNQPNITRAIKNLEKELGCTLFVRSNRKIFLTPEGEKLYSHVAIAFEHLHTAEAELSDAKSLQSGIVSIGATEIALHCVLLPVLKEFRRLHPGVHIHIANHSTPQALQALKNGLIDFAVVTTPMELPSNMTKYVLKQVREVPVYGPAYAKLTQKDYSITELMEHPFICLGTQTKTYELYRKWFASHGVNFSPYIEAATADQILPLVKHDLGIGFVPEEFLKNESETTGIYRLHLKEETPMREICLVKQKEASLSIAAEKLKKMLF